MLGYLDGQNISMVVAAIGAGGAGVAVLVKMYWYRFTGVFSKQQRAKADEAQLQLIGDRVEQADAEADADAPAPR